MLRRLPSRRPARRVALRDADGAQGVEAAPLPKIGPRLRGATVGDTTFGPVAEGVRRQEVKDSEANANSKHGGGPSSLFFGSEGEDNTPRALKPTPGASTEVTCLRYFSGRNAKIGEDRVAPAS